MNKLIKQLQEEGFRVRVWHGRFEKGKERAKFGAPLREYLRSKAELHREGLEISPYGGATGVRIFDGETDVLLAEGWSRCNRTDPFDPRRGIEIAAGRAAKALADAT